MLRAIGGMPRHLPVPRCAGDDQSLVARSGLLREKRHMHQIGGFTLNRISVTVVAGCRRHAFRPTIFCTLARSAPASSSSEIYVRRMSCGVKGATPAAAARSRRKPPLPHPPAAAHRLVRRARLGQTTRRRRARAPPAMHRRLPLYQTVPGRSIRSALSARLMMVNVASSAYNLRRKRCRTGRALRPSGADRSAPMACRAGPLYEKGCQEGFFCILMIIMVPDFKRESRRFLYESLQQRACEDVLSFFLLRER